MDGPSRLSRLIELLRTDGSVDVAAAAERFGTAEITIRRDLDVLVDRGMARRVRGGAVNLLMRGDELPFALREVDAVDAKRAIAAAAAGLITDGEAVALDSGTTVVEVAVALGARRLTVLPLSLHAAMACAGSPAIRLILPGGETRPGELAVVGAAAVKSIEALRFDTVVLSCCAVSDDGTVMAHDPGDAAIKQALVASGRRIVLVVDATKFGRDAMSVAASAADVDVLVTDAPAGTPALAAFAAAGTELVRV